MVWKGSLPSTTVIRLSPFLLRDPSLREVLLHRKESRRGGLLPEAAVELLVWVGGPVSGVEAALQSTLLDLGAAAPTLAVTFVLDGPAWRAPVERAAADLPGWRMIELSRATGIPGLGLGIALLQATRPHVAFAWPGCRVDPGALASLAAARADADLVHGAFAPERAGAAVLPAEVLRGEGEAVVPPELGHPVAYGHLQLVDAIPMHACVVGADAVRRLGTFDPAPWLARHFWWELVVRLARHGTVRFHSAPTRRPTWSWRDYPLGARVPTASQLACRHVAFGGRRLTSVESFIEAANSWQEDILADQPPSERHQLIAAVGGWAGESRVRTLSPSVALAAGNAQQRHPQRILVLGGIFEPHHNQLCFFNFFERVRGRGVLSWRTALYDTVGDEELEAADLVVFSRPRYPRCPELMDACRRRGLATLAMIDDNWIAAGREFERYAGLFTPGKPAFEAFVYCLKHADATLVYNPLLAEDISPHARRVIRIPANVELAHFQAPNPRRDGRFMVGFVGSPRFLKAGFVGAAAFLEARPEAFLFVMAHEVPEELKGLAAAGRLHFVPFTHSYLAYASTVSAMRPDVLLAPLDSSRFAASKCPNKYLETVAAGAVGVYSRVEPYLGAVRDGVTGLLADDEPTAWHEALERLWTDSDLRQRILEASTVDVRRRHSTETVLPGFLDVLEEVQRLGKERGPA